MRVLVIDTATPALSLALFEGDRLIAHDHRHVGRGHAELLLPSIAALPDGGRAARIMVSCGPGSFTGIRVGLAAARALGFAWTAEVIGYDTLALIAAGAGLPAETGCGAAISGGHGQWFVSEPGLPSMSMTPAEAAARLRSTDVAGDAAAELVALRGHGVAHVAEADARHALSLPATALHVPAHPVYGRPPDARPAAA